MECYHLAAVSDAFKMTAEHYGTRLLLRLIRKKRLFKKNVRKWSVACYKSFTSILSWSSCHELLGAACGRVQGYIYYFFSISSMLRLIYVRIYVLYIYIYIYIYMYIYIRIYIYIYIYVSQLVILSLNFKSTDYGISPIYRGIFLTSLLIYPVFLIERQLSIIAALVTSDNQYTSIADTRLLKTTPILLKEHKISAQT